VAWELETLMEDLGHLVCGTAASQAGAIEAARRDAPDLILMDVNLGRGGNGIDAAEEIRRDLAVPIVFCTAYSDSPPLVARMEAVGAAEILGKPISTERLRTVLRRIVGTET
jgi:CheY-like chemotaxis protein